MERGGGESDNSEDVARGSSGKSSSHSYPAPERGEKKETHTTPDLALECLDFPPDILIIDVSKLGRTFLRDIPV